MSLSEGEYAPRPAQPKRTTTTTLPTKVAAPVAAPDPFSSMPDYDAIARQEAALSSSQAQAQNASQASDLQSLIDQLQQQETTGLADYGAQVKEIGRNAQQAQDEANRQSAFAGAFARRNLAGRGLALSGIRLGAESRNAADLLRAMGLIGQEKQSRTDAINRAIESLKNSTESQTANAKAKLGALSS